MRRAIGVGAEEDDLLRLELLRNAARETPDRRHRDIRRRITVWLDKAARCGSLLGHGSRQQIAEWLRLAGLVADVLAGSGKAPFTCLWYRPGACDTRPPSLSSPRRRKGARHAPVPRAQPRAA